MMRPLLKFIIGQETYMSSVWGLSDVSALEQEEVLDTWLGIALCPWVYELS